ncbi:hypothetical protein HMPREF1144_5755 [Klebsiella sp. OBRC7]|nr:hypothetical protein HMPREF1144_5755 [Klebsiella sp. OBRC7]
MFRVCALSAKHIKKVIYRTAILFFNTLILLFIIKKLSISFATGAAFYPH